MTWGELLIAASLLTGSADAESFRLAFPTLRFALLGWSLEWELLDDRETKHTFQKSAELAGDLKTIRRLHKELWDAPPLCDHWRFPSRDACTEMLAFNRAYKQALDSKQLMDQRRWWYYQAVQRENEECYMAFDLMRDAGSCIYWVTCRRRALKQLRELIGADDYYSGRIPPMVPAWRFEDIR